MAGFVAWADDAGDTSIYWLNGMAGTGKTAIAFTFCQILDNTKFPVFCSHLDADSSNNFNATPTKAASECVSAPRPLIIVIDALDKCADQSDVSDVLVIIRQYSPTLPLKFFITSHPKRQIQNVFRQEGTSRYSKFINIHSS